MRFTSCFAAIFLTFNISLSQSVADCTETLIHSAYATHGLSGVSVPDHIDNSVVVIINPSTTDDLRTRWFSREAKIRMCQYGNCYQKIIDLKMPPTVGYPFNEPVFYMRRDELPDSPGWINVEIREVLRGFGEDGSIVIKGCPIQYYTIPI